VGALSPPALEHGEKLTVFDQVVIDRSANTADRGMRMMSWIRPTGMMAQTANANFENVSFPMTKFGF
jgi:hypothetical protein